jgi:hypothetical protein
MPRRVDMYSGDRRLPSLQGQGGRVSRPPWLVPFLLVAAAAAFGAGFANASVTGRLVATVRPCQILAASGSTSQPRPGIYAIVVKDTSRSRYFSLVGPGVRKRTSLSYLGTAKWTLRLKRGTYRFQCGSARAQHGVLIVG